MESLEQPFIGPERVDARVGEHFSRPVSNYGDIALDQQDMPNGEAHFVVAWRNKDGETETLYDGTSYLDAHRVLGYSSECISKEHARGDVLPKIAGYVEKINGTDRGQLTQEDFLEDNLDAAKERGRQVEAESAAEYR